MTATRHPLGRIGQLADDLRGAARDVANGLHLTPGGDAYEYQGSTGDVETLLATLNALERFLEGWVN